MGMREVMAELSPTRFNSLRIQPLIVSEAIVRYLYAIQFLVVAGIEMRAHILAIVVVSGVVIVSLAASRAVTEHLLAGTAPTAQSHASETGLAPDK